VLEAIARQEVDFRFEVVALDSGSTDGSVDLLAGKVDRLERIPNREFDHGLTRNRLVGMTRGELVVLLVQDAIPADASWLGALVTPLRSGATVAGSFARQIARPDASALTRFHLGRWVAAGAEPYVSAPISAEEFDRLAALERMRRSTIDNVCSCIRRGVWERHPFASTRIAEDLEWGRDVVRAGHRLAFAPEARVIHSHERSFRYELGRTYLLHRRLFELFSVRTVPSLAKLLRAVGISLLIHAYHAVADVRRPKAALRTLRLTLAWPLGQYLGGKAAVERLDLLSPSGI
jgi:rhamnosyltransferase